MGCNTHAPSLWHRRERADRAIFRGLARGEQTHNGVMLRSALPSLSDVDKRAAHRRARTGKAMIRVAVLGLGRWGPNLLRNLNNGRTCQVKWAIDPSEARRKAFAERYPDIH